MNLLDQLLEHDRWATAQLLDASRGLTDQQLDREFDIGHRTLRATYDHMFFIVEFWARVATGQPRDGIERDKHSIEVLTERHVRSYDHFATLAHRMRDDGRVDDTFVDHWGGDMSFGGMILHVILHNAEHRTEATHILNRIGLSEVPEVDHGLWDLDVRGA